MAGGGRLVVLGGSGLRGRMLLTAEIFDPAGGGGGGGGGGGDRYGGGGEWRLDPSGLLPGRRFGAAAVAVRGGPPDE